MKLIGRFKDFSQGFTGERSITFSIESHISLNALNELQGKQLAIEVKEHKNSRSLNQNRLLWKMIHDIAHHTGHSDYEIYVALLERADVLSDFVYTNTEMIEALRKSFRAVQFVTQINDQYIYKVYFGSSKMNTAEMNRLIEEAEKLASEEGVLYGQ